MRALSNALLVLLLATLVAACGGDDENADGVAGAAGSLAEAQNVLAEISGSGDRAIGDRVSVGGEVVRVAERAFVLEAQGEQLLVVEVYDSTTQFEEGQTVIATGRVTDLPEGNQPGLVTEDPIFREYAGQPVVAANSAEAVE